MKMIQLIGAYVVFCASLLGMVQQAYAADTLNINTATAEELQQMKGVGETRAQAIVDYRDEHGPFTQVNDLLEVEGIGEVTLAHNRDLLIVE